MTTPIPPIDIPGTAVIPPYVPVYGPVPNITPFTYRDGATYLQILEGLRTYINRTIVPFVNGSMSDYMQIFEDEVNRLIDAINDAIEDIINSSITIQDPIVAQLIEDVNSLTHQALVALHPVYRVWDGAAYPDRVEGAVNIFFGPEDPGLVMSPDDYWANPYVTTLDEVESEAGDSSSDLYKAIQSTAASVQAVKINLVPGNETVNSPTAIGTAPAKVMGYLLPETTGLQPVYGFALIPVGWTKVSLVFRYTTKVVETVVSNTRFFIDTVAVPTNTAIGVGNRYITTAPIPLSGKNTILLENHVSTVVGGDGFSIAIQRDATNAGDTYAGDLVLLDAWLVKA